MWEDISTLKKDIQEYVEVRMDLIRLHTAENLSRIFSTAVTLAVTGYFLFFILLFLSMAAGYFFGTLLQSDVWGFLCVAGFYVLVLIVFLIFRKKIVERPVIRSIMKLFFPKFSSHEK